jgi:hypothetical protein
MEIEITSLLENDQFYLSHSRAEGGQNAGSETWSAALAAADETPLLDTEEKLQSMRDFAESSGGWDEDEIAAWTDQEINALFLQWIAGDCRECPALENSFAKTDSRYSTADALSEIDWRKTRRMQESGQIPSNLFKTGRKIYFSLTA